MATPTGRYCIPRLDKRRSSLLKLEQLRIADLKLKAVMSSIVRLVGYVQYI